MTPFRISSFRMHSKFVHPATTTPQNGANIVKARPMGPLPIRLPVVQQAQRSNYFTDSQATKQARGKQMAGRLKAQHTWRTRPVFHQASIKDVPRARVPMPTDRAAVTAAQYAAKISELLIGAETDLLA